MSEKWWIAKNQASEPAKQEAGHTHVHPGDSAGSGAFVIVDVDQPAVLHQPSKGSLRHPATGKHVEVEEPFDAPGHFDLRAGPALADPVGEVGTAEGPIDPALAQLGKATQQAVEQAAGTCPFGRVGWFHPCCEHCPEGANQQKALASPGLLGGVVIHLSSMRIATHRLPAEGGRDGPAAVSLPKPGASQGPVVESVAVAVAAPLAEEVIDRVARRKEMNLYWLT